MKILIITIIDNTNYGNRLQNYALQSILQKEFAAEVETGIRVYIKKVWVKETQSLLKRSVKTLVPMFIYKRRMQSHELCGPLNDELINKRWTSFTQFTSQHLSTLPAIYVRSEEDISAKIDCDQYDYVIVGSDQVWNPIFFNPYVGSLSFVPPEKRLSFAASISIPELSTDQASFYKREWLKFQNLSVREEAGARMVESITGRKAEVTLDPTLLADPSIYSVIEKKPDYPVPEHYLLTYFLGALPKPLEEYSKKSSLPVLRLNDPSDPVLYAIDPEEFVYLIHHCDGFYTDSFHGVAFSLIFHRPFYVYHRNQEGMTNMFSRIETVLSKFSLMERIRGNDELNVELIPIQNVQWENVDRIRKEEYSKAVAMLKNATKK